jgi:hypothetical protein
MSYYNPYTPAYKSTTPVWGQMHKIDVTATTVNLIEDVFVLLDVESELDGSFIAVENTPGQVEYTGPAGKIMITYCMDAFQENDEHDLTMAVYVNNTRSAPATQFLNFGANYTSVSWSSVIDIETGDLISVQCRDSNASPGYLRIQNFCVSAYLL